MPSLDQPEWVYMDTLTRPSQMSLHGHPQMTRLNKFTWTPTLLKWRDKGEPGKQATQTCIKPTLGNNLAFLIRAHVPRCTLAWPTRMSLHGHPHPTHPNEFTRTPLTNPPKRVYTDALAWLAWMSLHERPHLTHPKEFKWMPSPDLLERVYMDTLKQPARTSLHGHTHDRNEGTRERWENELHEHAQSPPQVTGCHFWYVLMCLGATSH